MPSQKNPVASSLIVALVAVVAVSGMFVMGSPGFSVGGGVTGAQVAEQEIVDDSDTATVIVNGEFNPNGVFHDVTSVESDTQHDAVGTSGDLDVMLPVWAPSAEAHGGIKDSYTYQDGRQDQYYADGSTFAMYPDGTSSFYDGLSGLTTKYDASGKPISDEASSDGEVDKSLVAAQELLDKVSPCVDDEIDPYTQGPPKMAVDQVCTNHAEAMPSWSSTIGPYLINPKYRAYGVKYKNCALSGGYTDACTYTPWWRGGGVLMASIGIPQHHDTSDYQYDDIDKFQYFGQGGCVGDGTEPVSAVSVCCAPCNRQCPTATEALSLVKNAQSSQLASALTQELQARGCTIEEEPEQQDDECLDETNEDIATGNALSLGSEGTANWLIFGTALLAVVLLGVLVKSGPAKTKKAKKTRALVLAGILVLAIVAGGLVLSKPVTRGHADAIEYCQECKAKKAMINTLEKTLEEALQEKQALQELQERSEILQQKRQELSLRIENHQEFAKYSEDWHIQETCTLAYTALIERMIRTFEPYTDLMREKTSALTIRQNEIDALIDRLQFAIKQTQKMSCAFAASLAETTDFPARKIPFEWNDLSWRINEESQSFKDTLDAMSSAVATREILVREVDSSCYGENKDVFTDTIYLLESEATENKGFLGNNKPIIWQVRDER